MHERSRHLAIIGQGKHSGMRLWAKFHETAESVPLPVGKWMVRTALAAMGVSVALMVAVGILGPSSAVPKFAPSPPWPPWFVDTHPSRLLVIIAMWTAVLLGGGGLALALLAVRRGWRPRPRRLIAGSVVAVVALMVIPPIDSADMLIYGAYGRIAVLGHSPDAMTPGQLMSSGDPVGAEAVFPYANSRSPFGPIATVSEAAASELGGTSLARTIFWLKVWNAMAYLTLVLALDRAVRSDAARRLRAHLLWSVNPLMLLALLAGGHNDAVAVAVGASALFVVPRADSVRSMLSGALVGVATAIKAPYALFGAGLAWAARRSPRTLAALALGAAAVLVPSYLLAGRAAISATFGQAATPPIGPTPWEVLLRVSKVVHWHVPTAGINLMGLIGSAALAVVLLWRMPPGPREFPGVRVALALVLAWLLVSPQELPWYAAMIFPLLAVFPASRLDWIALAFASASALGEMPVWLFTGLHPAWLSSILRISERGIAPLSLIAVCIALLWLCITNSWRLARSTSSIVEAIPGDPDRATVS